MNQIAIIWSPHKVFQVHRSSYLLQFEYHLLRVVEFLDRRNNKIKSTICFKWDRILFYPFSHRFGNDLKLSVPWTRHHQLPFWERSPVTSLPWRTCPPSLPEWRGTLHRLQAVWGHLPGAGKHKQNVEPLLSSHVHTASLLCAVLVTGHNDRSRDSSWWQQENHTLRHWHDQMYLLWLLSGGLSCWCNCSGNNKIICRTYWK